MEPRRRQPEIEITGPDDVKLMIRPAPTVTTCAYLLNAGARPATDCQLWSINNGALRSLPEIRLEISSTQTLRFGKFVLIDCSGQKFWADVGMPRVNIFLPVLLDL
jgi:hypothetical protein